MTKEHESRRVGGKDKFVLNPIVAWSVEDVWHFLNDVTKVPHCVLYDEGLDRVGCMCCPLASSKKKKAELKRWPAVEQAWRKVCEKLGGKYSGEDRFKRWIER